jgi:hypothetical protein
MCLPALVIAATIASAAISAYGAYQQQKSANAAANYNAQIQNRNAEIANMQAENTVEQGAVAEKQHRLQVSELEGTQRAAASGSGLLVDSGSNLDVTKDTQGFGELDALTIRNNYARQAWGIQNQSADFRSQAQMSTMGNSSPFAAAAPSLLSGASSLSGQLASNKKLYGSYTG